MNETGVYDFKLEYTFAGNALAELDRQLALLLSTREGTMPLDREFGLNMDFVDMPPEVAKSLYTAEVTEKVAKFIPTEGPGNHLGHRRARKFNCKGGDHKCLTK